jgi:hypothetical protein
MLVGPAGGDENVSFPPCEGEWKCETFLSVGIICKSIYLEVNHGVPLPLLVLNELWPISCCLLGFSLVPALLDLMCLIETASFHQRGPCLNLFASFSPQNISVCKWKSGNFGTNRPKLHKLNRRNTRNRMRYRTISQHVC